MARLDKLNNSSGGENVAELRKELQNTMQNHFGVFRNGEFMREGIKKLERPARPYRECEPLG